jgi:hypothetical protein
MHAKLCDEENRHIYFSQYGKKNKLCEWKVFMCRVINNIFPYVRNLIILSYDDEARGAKKEEITLNCAATNSFILSLVHYSHLIF